MQSQDIAVAGVESTEQTKKKAAPPMISGQICTVCRKEFCAQGRRNACGNECRSFLGRNEDECWLFDKIEKRGDCWIWMGACDNKGHPVSYRTGESGKLITRIARKIFGYPETKFRISRGCKEEKCVNPEHWLDDEERFYDKMMPLIDGCIVWTGGLGDDGYGVTKVAGKQGRVTRIVWEREHGPIGDPKLFCCHTCDRPFCVNVDHLFLGGAKANMDDCIAKKRNARKLTEELVAEAKARFANGESKASISRDFGVHEVTVGVAVRGETWKHVK